MKILGMANAVIGDIIMSLPMLTYFEKKYNGSYKNFLIEKKCSQAAPLFFNHPLIDRIKITDNWDSFGPNDLELADQCDIVISNKPKNTSELWYNHNSCVIETAAMRGITDIQDVLTEDELFPKLYKWFDVGLPDVHSTYSKSGSGDKKYDNVISIWPFAGSPGRSPSKEWWQTCIGELIGNGYDVFHFGMPSDPRLSDSKNYYTFPHISYFEQVKAALATRLSIGTDSGAMWVMGAYSHPAINLMTNWLPNHNSNLLALEPKNKNGTTLYAKDSCDSISIVDVLSRIKTTL